MASAAVALAGCTAGENDPPPLGERDRTAVVAALRALDTCALLSAASEDVATLPAGSEIEVIFPARCALTSDAVPLHYVSIDVLDRWPKPIEYGDFDHLELHGVTAYVDDTQGCYVYLPVSPTTAIEVQGVSSGGSCDLAEPVAAAAVEILDDPDQVLAEPRWDPCDALRAAHGGTAGDYEGTPFLDTTCVYPAAGTEFSFLPGTPRGHLRDVDDPEWRSETVADAEVWFGEDPAKGDCYARWTVAGEQDSPYLDRGLVAQVRADSCADARTVLEPMVGVLQQPPPEVSPQRPVLYPA